MEGVSQTVWREKGIHRSEPMVANAPTNVHVDVVPANAVSEAKSIAKDMGDIGFDIEATLFARSRLSKATHVIDVVG